MWGFFGVLAGWLGLGAAGFFGASAAADVVGDVFRVVERLLDQYSWPILLLLLFIWAMKIRPWRDQ